MSVSRNVVGALAGFAGLVLPACQTAGSVQPAVLVNQDEESIAAIKSVLSEAMGRAKIEIGAGDLTKLSTLSVLPPELGPHEMNSPAIPEQFDIMTQNGNCMLVHQRTGDTLLLEGVACRKAAD